MVLSNIRWLNPQPRPAPAAPSPNVKFLTEEGTKLKTLPRDHVASRRPHLENLLGYAEGSVVYPFVLSEEAVPIFLARRNGSNSPPFKTINVHAARHLAYHLEDDQLVREVDEWVSVFLREKLGYEAAIGLLEQRRLQAERLLEKPAVRSASYDTKPFVEPEPGLFEPFISVFAKCIKDLVVASKEAKEQGSASQRPRLEKGHLVDGPKQVLGILRRLRTLGDGYLAPVLEGLSGFDIDFLFIEKSLERFFLNDHQPLALAAVSDSPSIHLLIVKKLLESLQTEGFRASVRTLCNMLLFISRNVQSQDSAELLAPVKSKLVEQLRWAEYPIIKDIGGLSFDLLLELIQTFRSKPLNHAFDLERVANLLDNYLEEKAGSLSIEQFEALVAVIPRRSHDGVVRAIKERFREVGTEDAGRLYALVDLDLLSRDALSRAVQASCTSFQQRLLAQEVKCQEQEMADKERRIVKLEQSVNELVAEHKSMDSLEEIIRVLKEDIEMLNAQVASKEKARTKSGA